MPKDVTERIIDWPYSSPSSRGGSVSVGGGGGGGSGGATNLDALTDVTVSTPLNGQVLSYNSTTGQWVNSTAAASVPNPHGLSSSYHSGKLNWPLIDFAALGSSLSDIVTRPHSALTGIGPNDHHNQAHVLATGTALGGDHTISGATAGQVLRASGPTTAQLTVLHHTDLDNILPDQHHAQVHNIVGTDHTVTGADFTVVGVHPANTVALLPTSSAPGAAVSILKTDANGGIQLDTNLLYVDGANNWIGVNRTPSGATLDVIASSNADHTQRLKMKSGQTGRLWRIEDLTGNELIVLDSVGNLQSGQPGFVSGLTGWRISPQGNAEFNNIWARGELHATVFVKDEVHATGGTLIVATAGVLHDDAIINSTLVDDDVLLIDSTAAGHLVPLEVVTTSGTFTGTQLHVSWIGNIININDPPSGPGFYFNPGDVLRSKTEVATGVTDFWFTVNSATQNTGYSSYSVFKQSGTDGTLPKGSAVVSYGQQGSGRILMTSDLNYAPYMDVFTTGPNVWTGAAGAICPRVRLGRLDGIGLPGVSGVEQYGIIAGQDLSDANQGYFIASNLQLALYKVNMRLNNGVSDTGLWTADGNLKIGSNVGATATTGFQVITTGARAGDVVIGNEATGYFLRWQQATGQLTVSGNLIVSDPGTTVTKAYVDSQDSAYDSLAQGYGTTGQTNAQTYSDARRIVGVNGSWYSPGTNQVSWGTKGTATGTGGAALSVVFANPNTSRAIADPSGASITIAARTYLYVSMAGTGTMTMLTTTSIATVSAANNVLIAVCDPGDPSVPAAARLASITAVAGTTYVSGGNIFTGSITAGNIASRTILAGNIFSGTITGNEIHGGEITTAHLAAATITSLNSTAQDYANTAQATAVTQGNLYKLQAVRGNITVTGQRAIAWSSVLLFYADGSQYAITDGTFSALSASARSFIYYAVGGTTFASTTTLAELTATTSLIAVFDPGATTNDPGSLSIVGGGTYISGNNIVTGGIIAANIQAGAVTAAKISVTNLQAVNTATGSLTVNGALTVNTTGNIQSSGKTSYNSSTAGFFLGYQAGLSNYAFGIGDGTSWLRWDGSNLSLQTAQPITILSSSGGSALIVQDPANSSHNAVMTFGYDSTNSIGFLNAGSLRANEMRATKFYVGDGTAPSSLVDMIVFRALGGVTNALQYNNQGILNYNGALQLGSSLIATGQVITTGNAMRIATSSTPTSATVPTGGLGEIRWDSAFIYVWVGSAWKKAQLNVF